MAPYKVILVRHGETAWNQAGRFTGQSDPELIANGILQAQAVAEFLLREKIDLLYSSDLVRALQTSHTIAQVLNVPVTIVPSLREINFGLWEGLTFSEIENQYPLLSSEWLKDPFQVRIPAGETADEITCRVIEAWNSIALNVADSNTVVIVAHGGPLRILFCHLTGLDPCRQWEFNPGHGEATILVQTGDTYSMLSKVDKSAG